jgi:hypothetical protein
MVSNEELQSEVDDLRIAVQGMFGMLKHLTVEIGDFSHTLSEVGTQFMTRMGFIWESLGGKVPEKPPRDSDIDSGADVIPIRPRHADEPDGA